MSLSHEYSCCQNNPTFAFFSPMTPPRECWYFCCSSRALSFSHPRTQSDHKQSVQLTVLAMGLGVVVTLGEAFSRMRCFLGAGVVDGELARFGVSFLPVSAIVGV